MRVAPVSTCVFIVRTVGGYAMGVRVLGQLIPLEVSPMLHRMYMWRAASACLVGTPECSWGTYCTGITSES
jgi:hypothetical protein